MKLADVLFLEIDHVLLAHTIGLSVGGGLPGVRDHGMLASAVMAARSGYYTSLAELAAVYTHGIAMDHAFFDGNKRAALLSAMMFLRANGFVPDWDAEWADILENVAKGEISRAELAVLFAITMGEPGDIEE